MKVLVTGGAGFIGSHLCDALLERGDEVVCVDNLNDYYNPEFKEENISGYVEDPAFKFYKEDIRNQEALEKIFKDEGIKKVVHLAARAGVRPSLKDPLLYADVNINGTLNLLECARDSGVENFVFGSSSSVYGATSSVPFTEDDPCDKPLSPYAATKRADELLCHTYHYLYGIPMCCLRFFTVYGPRGRPDMAVYKFTKAINAGDAIEVYGDGTAKRDFTYVDDIIAGVIAAIDKKFEFELINLGNNNPVEVNRLIAVIEDGLGKKATIQQGDPHPGDVPITYADVTKAKKLLGYEPKIKIEEGIKKFVEWYKNEKR